MRAMASRPSQTGQKDYVTSTRHSRRHSSNRNTQHATKVLKKENGMSIARKIMLCGQFVGMEGTMNFQQIYTVPVLQTLGMPLSLTYIVGLVSGSCSLLSLPLFGWFIDREHNSQRRKFFSLVLSAALQIVGMLCLLSGNVMHLWYLLDYNATAHRDTVSFGSLNASRLPDWGMESPDSEPGQNISWLQSAGNADVFADDGESDRAAHGSSEAYDGGNTIVPFKAGLGLFGLILMEIGFDFSNGFIKTFILTCSPRTEQTSLILLAVIMGSVGGVINAALGVVDLTSLLGLDFIEGAQLTLQTSIQGMILIVIILCGLLFTFCTGWMQLQDLQKDKTGTEPAKIYETRNRTDDTKCHVGRATSYQSEHDQESENGDRRSLAVAFENSIRSLGGNSIYMDPSVTLLEDDPHPFAEDVPLLEEDTRLEDGNEEKGIMIDYGSIEPMDRGLEESSSVKTSPEVDTEVQSERNQHERLFCLRNPKIRILFVCITIMFGTGAYTMYTYAISDFVGKAVYGGDPEAPPGSDSLNSYQNGMKMASWSLLVYFTTYLVVSIAHPAILAVLGFRLEYQLLQLLLVAMMLVTGMTSRLEAVFALSVVAGMHRVCFYSMPYAVTNDIAQTIASTSSGRNPVSLAMSLVAASVPLGNCLLCSWTGAFEELTGDVSAPLWLGTANGAMGVIAFLFVGKV